MKSSITNTIRKPYFMAVVLGTALATLGTDAPANASEISPKAIDNVTRYCTACWRNARLPQDDWNDCTQEVLSRLLKTVPPRAWDSLLKQETEERREFVRAIDAVKKRFQRSRVRSPLTPDLVADSRDQQGAERNADREAMRIAADRVLSPRQQRILNLLCDGYDVAEIASELGVAPERVSDEKYKAIQRLRGYFGA